MSEDPYAFHKWKPDDFPPAHKKVRDFIGPDYRTPMRVMVAFFLAGAVALFLAWVMAGSPTW